MLKNILVTGASGFLGSYLLVALRQRGYHVRALVRHQKRPAWIDPDILNEVEWVEGDILDIISLEEAMEGMDAVIHSAAMVSFAPQDSKPLYQVNTEGTNNVVNAALEKKIKRLVHISSVAALGRVAGGGWVDEKAKWKEGPLHTHYARSKFQAELHAWRGYSEGLDTVIINPSTILGFGNWEQSSCAIFKQLYDGFRWYTGGLNGFVDVQDVARATLLLLERAPGGQRYIVNGDTWTFQQLQFCIADGFGRKRPSMKASGFLLGLAWRIEAIRSWLTRKRPLLTRESARVAMSATRFDNRKLLNDFPDFAYTPLEQTIREACTKYSQQARTSTIVG
ncbi:MAG: NAD-dependent epimerase/dehydratase family protein [Sphingomonadales bacterium]